MKKNQFNVLADKNDHDDEFDQAPKRKLSKKEKRQEEKVLREAFGDKVNKDAPNMMKDGKKVKDIDGNSKERAYDRHSGTGRQAFGNKKKGGFGKGNLAQDDFHNYEGKVQLEEEDYQKIVPVEKESEKHQEKHSTKKKKEKKINYNEKNFPSLSQFI